MSARGLLEKYYNYLHKVHGVTVTVFKKNELESTKNVGKITLQSKMFFFLNVKLKYLVIFMSIQNTS